MAPHVSSTVRVRLKVPGIVKQSSAEVELHTLNVPWELIEYKGTVPFIVKGCGRALDAY